MQVWHDHGRPNLALLTLKWMRYMVLCLFSDRCLDGAAYAVANALMVLLAQQSMP